MAGVDDWGAEPEPGLTREELASRAERTTAEFLSAVEDMEPERLRRPATIGIWSGRDCVAHCVVWHEYVVDVLRRSLDGTFRAEDFEYGDEDEFNERTAAALADVPLGELLDRLRVAASTASELLLALPEQEWRARDHYRIVAQVGVVEHLEEHRGDLRAIA